MAMNMQKKITPAPSSPCICVSIIGIRAWTARRHTCSGDFKSPRSSRTDMCLENVIINPIFTSSLGWNDVPPSFIHALASTPPELVTALPNFSV